MLVEESGKQESWGSFDHPPSIGSRDDKGLHRVSSDARASSALGVAVTKMDSLNAAVAEQIAGSLDSTADVSAAVPPLLCL